jgi:RNA polymerase sigma-70 factor (ECF subfamily)
MTAARDASTATRLSLIKRLKDLGDQESWETFYEIYHRLIHNMARRAGLGDAQAWDVVQETVVSVMKGIGAYRADPMFGSFKSWLLLITRRRIADYWRKHPTELIARSRAPDDSKRTPTTLRIADPASLDWDAVWNEQWRRNLFEVAIEKVKQQASPKEYLMFYQQVIKGWPAGKVAAKYDASRAWVYMAKYRVSKLVEAEVRRLERLER